MKTSIIIPSYNPTLKLPETINKLIPQSSFIDELIIIIDNENYAEYAKFLEDKYADKLHIKAFSQPNSGRAVSRNRGVEISTGDIIIFLDDDMLAESNLLEKHIQYHLKRPGIIVAGNGYRNPAEATCDFGKFLVEMEKGWKKYGMAVREITLSRFDFTACNMSLPKSLFKQLSGFDTRFSDGEDFDFAVRALQKDVTVIYDATLLAWHNDWPGIEGYIKRQNEYLEARMKILRTIPQYMEYFPGLKITKGNSLKKIISFLIRKTVRPWVISSNSLFKILPLKCKFFFYRLVIFACSDINR